MVEEEKKKKRTVESLGWLTESSIMPRKHKAIEGVGASSILELKAHLYKSQEEAKKAKELTPDLEFHRAKKKIAAHDVFAQKNSGVESRATKDKLALKAVNDGSVSYAALERKAELYDKLAKGQLPDEEEKEKYCVDFFSKTLEQDKQKEEQAPEAPPGFSAQNEDDIDDPVMSNTRTFGPGRTAGTFDNAEHKRFVREVHEEANQAREKTAVRKLRRQEQLTAYREKLRREYLLKQLEKLKAAPKADQPGKAES